MSRAAREVWLVGSPTFVARAGGCAWGAHDLVARPLAWSERRALDDGRAARAALAGGPDLVMLTSVHALTDLPPDAGRGLRAACVGVSTASSARARGFEVVTDEATAGVVRGGRALGERIAAMTPRPARVLWLCGRDRRPEPREPLRSAGIDVDEVVTYAMEPRAGFAAEVAAAPRPAAIVVGSPRGVDALAGALLDTERALAREVPVVVPRGQVTAARARAAFGARVCIAPPRDDGTGTDYAAAVAGALDGSLRCDDEGTDEA